MTEQYNSEKHYHIVLEATRKAGEMSIAAVCRALQANNVQWPNNFNNDQSPVAMSIDRDIKRARYEAGYRNII